MNNHWIGRSQAKKTTTPEERIAEAKELRRNTEIARLADTINTISSGTEIPREEWDSDWKALKEQKEAAERRAKQMEDVHTYDDAYAKMQKERDLALKLAEEAEAKMQEHLQEAEQKLEEGYEEAYQMLLAERTKAQNQEARANALEKVLNTALAAINCNKTLADHLCADYAQKEVDLYEEYDKKVKEKTNYIVCKVDEFLKMEVEGMEDEMQLRKAKEMLAKGGEALVREALGDKAEEYLGKMKEAEAEAEFKDGLKKGNMRAFMGVPPGGKYIGTKGYAVPKMKKAGGGLGGPPPAMP